MPRNLIIGTAGHIDHGKTALVIALTGRDTDRLAEEKARGISIDLGFAPLDLPDGSVAGIVDVPGHENFIRNMMAGATGVDLALLVVAADDGVMPQTREHLAILNLLGVSRGVVAITKIDLVEEDLLSLVEDEVEELLEGTLLEGSIVVRCSSITGQGVAELRHALELASSQVRLKDEELPARLPVDRVFTLRGIGTVVTGTLWSGTLQNGQRVEILPGGREARIRSIQVHDSERGSAGAGERVAVNLAGLSKEDVSRGDVLAEPGFLRPTYMVDARVTVLEEWPRPLKRGTRVRFHHGTREVMGRVYPMGIEAIGPGGNVPAQLRLEARVTCAPGDRFVLRSYSPVTTMGGGTVVDAHPPKHRLSDPAGLSEFSELEAGDAARSAAIHLARAGKPLSAAALALLSGVSPASASRSLESLASDGRAIAVTGPAPDADKEGAALFLSGGRYDEIGIEVTGLLGRFRSEKPLAEGMAKETLKKKVFPLWDARAADMLLERLALDGTIEVAGKLVRVPGTGASVTEEQDILLGDITARIEKQGVSPQGVGELSSELGMSRGALAELLGVAEKNGLVLRVSPDLYFSPGVLSVVEEKLRGALADAGEITVSQFRDLIGASRKYALPLLEYFDRNRVTSRVGDVRRLRES